MNKSYHRWKYVKGWVENIYVYQCLNCGLCKTLRQPHIYFMLGGKDMLNRPNCHDILMQQILK